MRYKNDPYQTSARFTSTCPGCHTTIKKGDPIIYWPKTRTAYCSKCGDSEYRRFLANVQDEENYNLSYGTQY